MNSEIIIYLRESSLKLSTPVKKGDNFETNVKIKFTASLAIPRAGINNQIFLFWEF